MGQLLAGAARIKLDPPLGLAMAGYGNRVGRAAGVHDDLAAQAIVLSDGASKVAIAGVDVLALGQRIADDTRARVAAKSDIDAGAIMICATPRIRDRPSISSRLPVATRNRSTAAASNGNARYRKRSQAR